MQVLCLFKLIDQRAADGADTPKRLGVYPFPNNDGGNCAYSLQLVHLIHDGHTSYISSICAVNSYITCHNEGWDEARRVKRLDWMGFWYLLARNGGGVYIKTPAYVPLFEVPAIRTLT